MIGLLQHLYNNISDLIATFRGYYWKLFCKKIGSQVRIMSGVTIMSPKKVSIGDYVFINKNSILSATCGDIEIGLGCMLATSCNLITANHGYSEYKKPMFIQPIFGGPIVLEDDVWLGANVVVTSNVRIGRGSIVGANSVVTKDVAPFSIVGGVPAKLLKYRFSENEIIKARAVKLDKYIFDRKKGKMHHKKNK